MRKQSQANSATAAIKAAINAASPLPDLPHHVRLRDRDLPFWDTILRARARDEWTGSDLVVAAQLARCQSDIESESLALETEGSVIENGKGSPVMNPRHSVLEQLSRREMALMRSLQMIGYAAKGDKRDVQKSRELQRKAEQIHEELADDNLLAI